MEKLFSVQHPYEVQNVSQLQVSDERALMSDRINHCSGTDVVGNFRLRFILLLIHSHCFCFFTLVYVLNDKQISTTTNVYF